MRHVSLAQRAQWETPHDGDEEENTRKGGFTLTQREKEELGKKVKEVRTDAGESMAEFGKRMKVSPTSVSNWESGESLMHEKSLDYLCKTYEVSKDWMLGKNMPKYPETRRHQARRECLNHAMMFMSEAELTKTETFLIDILDMKVDEPELGGM